MTDLSTSQDPAILICTRYDPSRWLLVLHFNPRRSIYEASSIKNANLSIKYEGIKLQKFLIACKKGINVVVWFQYSEIGWLENSIFQWQLSRTGFAYPTQHLFMNFQRPLLLYPQKLKKKCPILLLLIFLNFFMILIDFLVFFLSFFQRSTFFFFFFSIFFVWFFSNF